MTVLKPCPFCGGKGIFDFIESHDRDPDDTPCVIIAAVECEECTATVTDDSYRWFSRTDMRSHVYQSIKDSARARAEELWNARP